MKICTLQNEICTLRNETLYFVKWKSVLCERLIVLCEMVLCETKRNEICTLRNENMYFAKWNLYFVKWKSLLCEMKICTLRKEICTLRNENADLKTWDRGQKENNFSELVCRKLLRRNKHWALCFLHHCLRLLVDWLCFVLLRDNYINLISLCHPHYVNNSEGCSRSLCWVNIAWQKCTMKEHVIRIHFLPCFACPASSCKSIKHLVSNSS